MRRLLYSVLLTAMVISCGGRKSPVTAKQADAPAVEFNADSAFSFVKEQTDFGPRVPNTQAHDDCGIWLAARLSSFGADKVFVQNFNTKTFDNTTLKCMNIVGSFNLECPTRVILCSHWDSRPWADNDSDPSKHKTPVDAANDGASGVAVILEIARQLQKQAPQIGVDCIFFDAEEMAVQIHPPESEYVHSVGSRANPLENVLHLWRPCDGDWSCLNRKAVDE